MHFVFLNKLMMMTMMMIVVADCSRVRESGNLSARSSPRRRHKRSRFVSDLS